MNNLPSGRGKTYPSEPPEPEEIEHSLLEFEDVETVS
jgi:hypothetical protein